MFSTKCNGRTPVERGPLVRPGVAAIVLLVSMLPVTGLGQAIDTNRPGFSFTPGVVEQGTWQLETGLSYGRFGSASRTIALPNAEFRYGVGGGTEVFVSGISWID